MSSAHYPRSSLGLGVLSLFALAFMMHCAEGVDPVRPGSGGAGGAGGSGTSTTGTNVTSSGSLSATSSSAVTSSSTAAGPSSSSAASGNGGASSSAVSSSGNGGVGGMGQPTCSDGIKNQNETDVDCGGGTCNGCASGKMCAIDGDCLSMTCMNGTCIAGANCLENIPPNCPVCQTQNASDKPKCMEYLQCYLDNNCNPADPCGSNPDAICGVNHIGGGNAPKDAAVQTYNCACP